MSAVIDLNGNEIQLRRCQCGGDPEYVSGTGICHEIICPLCLRQTAREMCGIDAVDQWNAGRVQEPTP